MRQFGSLCFRLAKRWGYCTKVQMVCARTDVNAGARGITSQCIGGEAAAIRLERFI